MQMKWNTNEMNYTSEVTYIYEYEIYECYVVLNTALEK